MIVFSRVRALLAVLVLTSLAAFATETNGTISFTQPSDQATVGSTFHLLASGSADDPVYGITVYVNGRKTASSSGSVLDASISGVSGRTRVTVQAFNRLGHFQKTIYVNVVAAPVGSFGDTAEGDRSAKPPASSSVPPPTSSSAPPPTSSPVPAPTSNAGDPGSGGSGTVPVSTSAKIFRDVERLPGWESCTICAGPGGKGGVAEYAMRADTLSPSLDGHSARFDLGGNRPYADALWWKQLGPNDTARHFVYDLYFYVDKPDVAQALEFDVNQSTGGKKFIFGTECSIGRGVWDVWAADRSWIHTTVPCAKPTANTWHHLVWEFERTTDDQVKYVSVTLDGVKHYLNQSYSPRPAHAQEINVAFQMDGDRQQASYSVWLNKVQLSYW